MLNMTTAVFMSSFPSESSCHTFCTVQYFTARSPQMHNIAKEFCLASFGTPFPCSNDSTLFVINCWSEWKTGNVVILVTAHHTGRHSHRMKTIPNRTAINSENRSAGAEASLCSAKPECSLLFRHVTALIQWLHCCVCMRRLLQVREGEKWWIRSEVKSVETIGSWFKLV